MNNKVEKKRKIGIAQTGEVSSEVILSEVFYTRRGMQNEN